MNIGVVIQGGAENVQWIIETVRTIRSNRNFWKCQIVVSTWSDAKVDVGDLPDCVFLLRGNRPVGDNRHRISQASSSLAGVNFLKDNYQAITHVLKIRDDFVVSSELLQELTTFVLAKNKKLLVPYVNRTSNFNVADFFLFGEIDLVKSFYSAQFVRPVPIQGAVEVDFWLKYVISKSNRNLTANPFLFFTFIGMSNADPKTKLWLDFVQDSISCTSDDCLSSMKWRGRLFWQEILRRGMFGRTADEVNHYKARFLILSDKLVLNVVVDSHFPRVSEKRNYGKDFVLMCWRFMAFNFNNVDKRLIKSAKTTLKRWL